jgi:hypothetical protein
MVLTASMGSPGNRCRNEHSPGLRSIQVPYAIYAPFAVRPYRRGLRRSIGEGVWNRGWALG